MSFSQTGSTIQNPYANKYNSGTTLNTLNTGVVTPTSTPKVVTNPLINTPQTQATQKGLMNNKTFNSPVTVKAPVVSTSKSTTTAPVSQNLAPTATSMPVTNTYTMPASNTGNNAGMINLGNTQPQYKNDANLYGNVVTGLANTPQNNKELADANKSLQDLQNEYQKNKNLIQSRGWDLSEQGGAQGMLTQSYNVANAAAQDRIQNALTGESNQINALNSAGNLAKPMLANYGQQVFNPTNGSLSGGTLNDAVNQVVAKLQSGQMTYAEAENALSGYGQGGINALLSALPAGFNVTQSNTLAGQQGSIKPAYDFAKSALNNLQSIAKQLSGSSYIQGSNIPIINSIGNFLSTQSGVNSDLTRQYTGAIQEARNAYAQLLASSKGGTPTEYTGQSTAAIPDNATPNDIQAAINNLESLGQSKVDIYSNPGTSNNNTSTQVGSLGTYTLINGKWVYSK